MTRPVDHEALGYQGKRGFGGTSEPVPPRVQTYRVGRHLGRTIYLVVGEGPSERDKLIGIMDTVEDGALVVEALNARERFKAAERRPDRLARLTVGPPPLCHRTGDHDCPVAGERRNHNLMDDQPELPQRIPGTSARISATQVDHEALGSQGKLAPGGPADGPPACPRVGMHNCSVAGEWRNHDRANDLPDPS